MFLPGLKKTWVNRAVIIGGNVFKDQTTITLNSNSEDE
jgi:hypothetical protein